MLITYQDKNYLPKALWAMLFELNIEPDRPFRCKHSDDVWYKVTADCVPMWDAGTEQMEWFVDWVVLNHLLEGVLEPDLYYTENEEKAQTKKHFKFWEVTKILSEYPSKRFIRTSDGLVLYINGDHSFSWKSGYNNFSVYDDFIEVEMVSFRAALNSGKRIKSELWKDFLTPEEAAMKISLILCENHERANHCISGGWIIEN